MRMWTAALSALGLASCTCGTNPAPDAPSDAHEGADVGLDARSLDARSDVPRDVARLPTSLAIYYPSASARALEPFTRLLPYELAAEGIPVTDPRASAMTSAVATRIAAIEDGSLCDECYRLEREGPVYVVHGGASLGIQYGLAALLEGMGVRFFHPQRSFVPTTLSTPAESSFGRVETPEIAMRGLHLHTLHPIEAYFDFWEPSPEGLEDAERTLDWMVKNRANYVTWAAIDDLSGRDEARRAALTDHQERVVDLAHRRGMRAGIGIQLFGTANLQRAYDLVDRGADPATAIPARIEPLATIPYDAVHVSFGEFDAEGPTRFVSLLESTYDAIHARMPSALVTGTIHVGAFDHTRVRFMGEELLYYFLVKFAARPIRPWIHTVMYYNLFEDAGGAYAHDAFTEHRDFLLDRIRSGREVGYHPETAYWVAFDNSIPTYTPIYLRTRFTDLEQIRAGVAGSGHELEDHVVFSSGWEWGYWQNDWAVMQSSFHLPTSHGALIHQMLDPLPSGELVAAAVLDVADAQHRALLVERLAPFLASDDVTFEAGLRRERPVWSQPRRPSIPEVRAMSATERESFRTRVVEGLERHATELRAIATRIQPACAGNAFIQEICDGVDIDVERTRFATILWDAIVRHAAGEDVTRFASELDASLARARAIVRRRHDALHDPDPRYTRTANTALLYRYGYLRQTESLCFFQREKAIFEVEALGRSVTVPGCFL